MAQTGGTINAVLREIENLQGTLADDVISLRRDSASGLKEAETMAALKTDVAAKLHEAKTHLQDLLRRSAEFDRAALRLPRS